MSRSRIERDMPGHVATATPPGVAVPTKLRAVIRQGGGQLGDVQREANRLFITKEEGSRPDPHVVTVDDVTKGLGLDEVSRTKIHNVITGTRADYGASPALRVPRLPAARTRLMDVLRAMKEVDSTARMEIMRRAMIWWKKNVVTEMQGKPSIRFVVTKAQMESRDLLKAGPLSEEPSDDEREKEAAKAKGSQPKPLPKPSERMSGSLNPAKDDEPKEAKGKKKGKPDKDAKGKKAPKLNVDHEEYDDGEDEDGSSKKGQKVKFHPKVEANLPDDADYQFHVTEHAKHLAQHKALKETDPARAEAHRHAANLHARVGNALHSAGETERDKGAEAQQLPPGMEAGAEGDPTAGPPGAAPFKAKGSGKPSAAGKDFEGKPHPEKPDKKRNAPGRDSDVEAKRQAFAIKKSQGSMPFSLIE